ncbi:type III PLP-dependent enzyme [Cellulomonas sp. 179-A 4D5 NHS]|uniref:type III PLP-dependent enzyme n=1 Tax=Cellulomonas sp. 179-A 4D5 NHS TaxID=3142378 RepID=UPI0039A0B2A3
MTLTTAVPTGTELVVQGVSVNEIARTFGTPCYVYDGDVLRETLTTLLAALHPRVEVFYSLKANPNVSVYAVLHAHGARAEVSSLAELRTVLLAGTEARDILFLGPGKSRDELVACLDAGIHAIVCESLEELALIDDLAAEHGRRARVLLRLNPSFSVKGSGLTMGGKPRQFGIDDVQLLDGPPLGPAHPHVDLAGVQVYMGTRILSAAAVAENTRNILALAEQVAEHHGFPLETVDVGGGLGVAYFDGETDLDVDELAALLNPVVEEFAARRPGTRILMELGRYLTAHAGTYVTRVRYTKTSRGERFAVADGGTNHHMAAVGIGSFVKRNFPVALVSRTTAEPLEAWNVTGPLCTPNDVVARKADLPPLRTGDLVGVLRSGAYGPTASPVLFLSHGYPAEVLVLDGVPHLVREADTVDSLLGPQRLVDIGASSPAHEPARP